MNSVNTLDFIHRIYDDSKLNLEAAIWIEATIFCIKSLLKILRKSSKKNLWKS